MQRSWDAPSKIAGPTAGVMAIFFGNLIAAWVGYHTSCSLGLWLAYSLFSIAWNSHDSGKKWRSLLGKIPTLIIVVLPLALFFPPAFQQEVIVRCLGVFDVLRSAITEPWIAAHGVCRNGGSCLAEWLYRSPCIISSKNQAIFILTESKNKIFHDKISYVGIVTMNAYQSVWFTPNRKTLSKPLHIFLTINL